jgi:hypothetical protein
VAVTVESFKVAHPEFVNADDAQVEVALDDAILMCPESVWGNFTDQGVRLTTAQTLAQQPTAREMALNPDGSTVYDKRLAQLKLTVASGGRVV